LLGAVDLSPFFGGAYATIMGSEPNYNFGIHWVIVGGESGPGARPMHPDWVRSLRDQCVAAGVPFFFKRWGAWRPRLAQERFDESRVLLVDPAGRTHHSYPADEAIEQYKPMIRVGKKAAGRKLDGREWNEM